MNLTIFKSELKVYNVAITLACTAILTGCKDTKIHAGDEGIAVNVVKSSGDDFSYEINDSSVFFMPYPFNLGTSEASPALKEVVILSKKLESGTSVRVQPFGKLRVSSMQNGMTEAILSYPVDSSLRIFNIDDLYNFSSRHFAAKQLIEYWYLNRYGLNGATVESWENFDMNALTD